MNARNAKGNHFQVRFGLQKLPKIVWFPVGDESPEQRGEEYLGWRRAENIVSFVNRKTGLRRLLAGQVRDL